MSIPYIEGGDIRYWQVTSTAAQFFEERLDGRLIHYVLSPPTNGSTTQNFWGAWDVTTGVPICLQGTGWTRLDLIRNQVRKGDSGPLVHVIE